MGKGLIPRGRYRVTLRAPDLDPRPGVDGRRVRSEARTALHRWATYHALGGAEATDAAGETASRLRGLWVIRRAGLDQVSTRWTLEHGGVERGIVSVAPASRVGRGRSHLAFTTVDRD